MSKAHPHKPHFDICCIHIHTYTHYIYHTIGMDSNIKTLTIPKNSITLKRYCCKQQLKIPKIINGSSIPSTTITTDTHITILTHNNTNNKFNYKCPMNVQSVKQARILPDISLCHTYVWTLDRVGGQENNQCNGNFPPTP